jgi:holliday junction DNA helicase RuvA
MISTVPGIGKKTAQRIILDLKDKLDVADIGLHAGRRASGAGAAFAETTDALLAMGFSAAEVSVAVRGCEDDGADAQTLLRHALRRLGGGT